MPTHYINRILRTRAHLEDAHRKHKAAWAGLRAYLLCTTPCRRYAEWLRKGGVIRTF
ncbi:hypothetical protein [Methylohalobius crimeensis]|uniref:hypothetical protein n=1 Tax=Methylohalobius crimeensis TaxID=244365 RepID=UPI0003B5E5BA|nr:hypothetical protein [Methylohalobius crimeensis]